MNITQPSKADIDKHREFWAKVAKDNNWGVEEIYIQVWVDPDGNIADSVSYKGLTHDIVLLNIEDEQEDE